MRTDARGMWYDVRLVPPPLNTPLLVWDGDTILHAIKCVAYVGELHTFHKDPPWATLRSP